MSTPNPTVMQKFAHPVAEKPKAILVGVSLDKPGKIVRPGTRNQTLLVEHDGVVKAKHLRPGMEVRSWLHGSPRGSLKVVESVTRIDGGSSVRIEFSSKHVAEECKAAYRFHCEALVGTLVQQIIKVPALVTYEEV